MAKASEQFRQMDVTVWGFVALACAALAVFGANISALLPQTVLGRLHQPRVAGASIETLRTEVSNLTTETLRLSRANEVLVQRFDLQERAGSDVTRRVGALEVTVPQILEGLPSAVAIDRNSQTASIETGDAQTFDAQGGSVSVRHSTMPLASSALPPIGTDQPMPAPIADGSLDAAGYGVAIGPATDGEGALAQWEDLNRRLGPLLFGLMPRISAEATEGQRILAGPFQNADAANRLCAQLEAVSIACAPAPYGGTPLLSGQ